ncbi:MAG: hypothetical protein WKF97_16760 [Chitinophagaceae bacterium]
MPTASGAFIDRKTLHGNYDASALVLTKSSSGESGLAAIGNDNNVISAVYKNNKIIIRQVKEGDVSALFEKSVNAADKIYLQMQVRNAKEIKFLYSLDGKRFLSLHEKAVDGSFLPPWDRAVRVGLISKGENEQQSEFGQFTLKQL